MENVGKDGRFLIFIDVQKNREGSGKILDFTNVKKNANNEGEAVRF